jgi:protein-disulfide isomerase
MTTNRPRNSRAERRAAERRQARQRIPPPSQRSRFTIGQLSVAAAVAGVALVIILLFVNGLGSSGAGPIHSPDFAVSASLENDRTLGQPNAPITIEEWADFQCPICLQFYQNIEPPLIANYIEPGKVKLVFHDYAFIGPESTQAAAAARVSQAIGPGFWPFHDMLYSNQGTTENSGAFSQSRLADIAVALGMDRTAFLNALADPTYTNQVRSETAQGTQLGVNSTPTLVIDGNLYPGLPTWTQLSALIDSLASPSPSGSP